MAKHLQKLLPSLTSVAWDIQVQQHLVQLHEGANLKGASVQLLSMLIGFTHKTFLYVISNPG